MHWIKYQNDWRYKHKLWQRDLRWGTLRKGTFFTAFPSKRIYYDVNEMDPGKSGLNSFKLRRAFRVYLVIVRVLKALLRTHFYGTILHTTQSSCCRNDMETSTNYVLFAFPVTQCEISAFSTACLVKTAGTKLKRLTIVVRCGNYYHMMTLKNWKTFCPELQTLRASVDEVCIGTAANCFIVGVPSFRCPSAAGIYWELFCNI